MFVVYYRTTRGKSSRRFATRAAQVKFIVNAPMTWVITSYN